MLTRGIPPAFRDGVIVHLFYTVIVSAVPSRSFSTLRLNLVLTREIPPAFRDGVIVHLFHTVIVSAVPSRSFSTLRLTHQSGPYSRDSSRFPRRRHSPFLYTVNRYRVSPETIYIKSRHCVPMAFPAESPPAHRASSPQGSSGNGCCLFRCHHEPFFFCAFLFLPHPNTVVCISLMADGALCCLYW